MNVVALLGVVVDDYQQRLHHRHCCFHLPFWYMRGAFSQQFCRLKIQPDETGLLLLVVVRMNPRYHAAISKTRIHSILQQVLTLDIGLCFSAFKSWRIILMFGEWANYLYRGSSSSQYTTIDDSRKHRGSQHRCCKTDKTCIEQRGGGNKFLNHLHKQTPRKLPLSFFWNEMVGAKICGGNERKSPAMYKQN